MYSNGAVQNPTGTILRPYKEVEHGARALRALSGSRPDRAGIPGIDGSPDIIGGVVSGAAGAGTGAGGADCTGTAAAGDTAGWGSDDASRALANASSPTSEPYGGNDSGAAASGGAGAPLGTAGADGVAPAESTAGGVPSLSDL